jgi:hypothetical protein
MGEIKSTLDLVLEKTRHLTLSEEEKREQKKKDARSRLAGLLQRYQDGKLDARRMGEELDRLVNTGDGPDESLVRDEILGRIELGSENKQWLALLQARYRLDPSGVRSVEEDFREAVEAAAARREEEIKKELQQLGGISGSAVVPNLDSDHTWATEKQSIAANYHHRLTDALNKVEIDPHDI